MFLQHSVHKTPLHPVCHLCHLHSNLKWASHPPPKESPCSTVQQCHRCSRTHLNNNPNNNQWYHSPKLPIKCHHSLSMIQWKWWVHIGRSHNVIELKSKWKCNQNIKRCSNLHTILPLIFTFIFFLSRTWCQMTCRTGAQVIVSTKLLVHVNKIMKYEMLSSDLHV